jgi:hypothetical protein
MYSLQTPSISPFPPSSLFSPSILVYPIYRPSTIPLSFHNLSSILHYQQRPSIFLTSTLAPSSPSFPSFIQHSLFLPPSFLYPSSSIPPHSLRTFFPVYFNSFLFSLHPPSIIYHSFSILPTPSSRHHPSKSSIFFPPILSPTSLHLLFTLPLFLCITSFPITGFPKKYSSLLNTFSS